jgi:beta-galactosidase
MQDSNLRSRILNTRPGDIAQTIDNSRLRAPRCIARFGCYAILAALFVASVRSGSAQQPSAPHTFVAEGRQFLMDGKPYQIISGEMHYPRVPRAYWTDRFRMARAMGLNTITTYVFWNVHEPRPGVYDFSGQNDLAEYLREAQQQGLNVILRPGPYVCAEWDLGGYPAWLLKDRTLVLRSAEPAYLAAMNGWFKRLAQEVKPLLIQNGGPIIAVQVENEYGSFGDDHAYMKAVKDGLTASGITTALMYTADGPRDIPHGSLPELPAVINFGTGDAEKSFATLETMRPEGPRMSGEYWAGWFDHWGEKHHKTDGNREAAELSWMLSHGYSVSMYMFHGGSSFGWMNGSNSNGKNFQPDTTSYDYDAPLDEHGEPRAKFFAFRDAIAKATGQHTALLPAQVPREAFPIDAHMQTASLWRNLPRPKDSHTLLAMEDLDQSYGYILYRTGLDEGDGGELTIEGLHDYAQIYIDQKLVGSIDRRLDQTTLTLPPLKAAATLDILVENSGRVNYTKVIRTERKGIVGAVRIGSKTPSQWEIYSLPFNDLSALQFHAEPCDGPCFYRVDMPVSRLADTYLDTRGAHKGFVWINGTPLGRIWSIGPQYALYTPGPWLHPGHNAVVFFDLSGDAQDRLTSVKNPIFGESISSRN